MIPERVRFAPSPTGLMHLGSLRTALFNYLLARQTGGTFILRIEDTDKSRTVSDAVPHIINVLEWAGLYFDEGPGRPGMGYGSYFQSSRLSIYQKYMEYLLERGHAYRCFCSKERLEGMREAIDGGFAKYDGHCRNLARAEAERRTSMADPHVVRFRVPSGSTLVNDLVYGRAEVENRHFGDPIMIKSDGFPTYHFANVVDDHQMQVTTVMRGQEWLPSTPLHLLLYRAFEWSPPRFVHLPLLINRDGSKLSKRQKDAFVGHYRDRGYLPQAVLNFIALLGWTLPRNTPEVLDLDMLVSKFNVEGINRADALVDMQRLDWFNRKHLQREATLPDRLAVLVSQLRSLLRANVQYDNGDSSSKHTHMKINDRLQQAADLSDEYLENVLKLMLSRVYFVHALLDTARYYFIAPIYDTDAALSLWNELIGRNLSIQMATEILRNAYGKVECLEWDVVQINGLLCELATIHGTGLPVILGLIRLAITGCKMGASVAETMKVLGRERVLARLSSLLDDNLLKATTLHINSS